MLEQSSRGDSKRAVEEIRTDNKRTDNKRTGQEIKTTETEACMIPSQWFLERTPTFLSGSLKTSRENIRFLQDALPAPLPRRR